MKKIWLLLTLCCVVMGCKRVTVDFQYSPTEPRAGQPVKFSNLSSSGENWEWSFGDGGSTTIKSPTHTYKKPGTYRVQLKVDKKNSLTKSMDITIYDTVPTFICSDSTHLIYKDYTFTAQVYNPYNYSVSYEWYFPLNTEYVVSTDERMDGSSLHVYFLRPMEEAPIGLRVVLNGDTTHIIRYFTIENASTHSILLRTPETDYRQRIFGSRAEPAKADAGAKALLDAEQDTFQVYNGYAFYLSDMKVTFPELEGFHIANRKFYFRTDDGLWIANIDGSNMVQIDNRVCYAMILDTEDNRIYWSNADGVWYMPFIGSDNNQFVTIPALLNGMTEVQKLAADYERK